MDCCVYVKKISLDIEEEVTIVVNNIELTVFASICPYIVCEDMYYTAEIMPVILDNCDVKVISSPLKEYKRINNSFKYSLKGFLNENKILDIGILLDCSEIFDDTDNCNNYIELWVDRLQVEFK